MEQFIQQYPSLAVSAMYALLLGIGGLVIWGFKRLIHMLENQNTTLSRLDHRGIRHDARIRSLEFHAWGREPGTKDDDTIA